MWLGKQTALSMIPLGCLGCKTSTQGNKCPKITYTEVADKMAYAKIADPDQTSFRSNLIRVYMVFHFAKYLKKQLNKKQNLGQNSM